jgi:hypothetical protein
MHSRSSSLAYPKVFPVGDVHRHVFRATHHLQFAAVQTDLPVPVFLGGGIPRDGERPFYDKRCTMLFGDAKSSRQTLIGRVKEGADCEKMTCKPASGSRNVYACKAYTSRIATAKGH